MSVLQNLAESLYTMAKSPSLSQGKSLSQGTAEGVGITFFKANKIFGSRSPISKCQPMPLMDQGT